MKVGLRVVQINRFPNKRANLQQMLTTTRTTAVRMGWDCTEISNASYKAQNSSKDEDIQHQIYFSVLSL